MLPPPSAPDYNGHLIFPTQIFLSHFGGKIGNCAIKDKAIHREHQIEAQSFKWLKSESAGIKILEWVEEKSLCSPNDIMGHLTDFLQRANEQTKLTTYNSNGVSEEQAAY